MAQIKFEIDENGNVYQPNGQSRKPLGHVASLSRERTREAEQFRAWWRDQMAFDELAAVIEPPEPGDVGRGTVPDAALAVGGNTDERVEELVAGYGSRECGAR